MLTHSHSAVAADPCYILGGDERNMFSQACMNNVYVCVCVSCVISASAIS